MKPDAAEMRLSGFLLVDEPGVYCIYYRPHQDGPHTRSKPKPKLEPKLRARMQ